MRDPGCWKGIRNLQVGLVEDQGGGRLTRTSGRRARRGRLGLWGALGSQGAGRLDGPSSAYLSRVSTLGCLEPAAGPPVTRGGLQPPASPGPGPPAPSLPAAAAAAACLSMACRDRRHRGEAAVWNGGALGKSHCAPPEAPSAASRLRRSPPLAVTWRPRVTHKAKRGGGGGGFQVGPSAVAIEPVGRLVALHTRPSPPVLPPGRRN